MQKNETEYFLRLKEKVLSHRLKSGEIILSLYFHSGTKYESNLLFEKLLHIEKIKLEENIFSLKEITKNELINSIKYGLSTKLNYTEIKIEFDSTAQNKYAFGFLGLFDNPICYRVNSRIYKSNLDLSDFWKTGGGIALDNNQIGIFLINDLYSKFK